MTALRLRWQRSAAITATVATAFLGTAIAATPAQAHSKGWEVDCYSVNLKLTNYSQDKDNTVKITVGDKTVVSETFRGQFAKKVDLPQHTEELKVTADVVAGDDSRFSWNETKTSPVCESESPAPSPSVSEPSSPPPSSTPSQSEAPQPSTAPPSAPETSTSAPAAKPQGGGEDLAETGSSSNTPMIAGIAAAVVIVGGGLVAFARKRRSN